MTDFTHHTPKLLTEADAAADLAGVPRPVSTEDAMRFAELNEDCAKAWLDSSEPHKFRMDTGSTIRTLVSERDALAVRVRELEAENDQMVKALADCRNAFPVPEPGAQAEDEWMEAMTCPLSVPTFVRAALSATTPESKP